MPPSPSTPNRRRRSSGFGSPLTPTTSQPSPPGRRTHSRVSSIQSLRSPTALRPPSAQDRNNELGFNGDFAEHTNSGNGLGSLADELAEEEWDEDTYTEDGYAGEDFGHDEPAPSTRSVGESSPGAGQDGLSPLRDRPNGQANSRARHRARRSDYDGSDYGESDEFDEVEGISPSLDAKLVAIENLARQGSGNSNTVSQDVLDRVSNHLKDLSSQVNVETHIARLSNAHTALTTHLSHQSRTLASLAHPLSSPLSIPPDPDFVESLIPLVETLFSSLPQPPLSTLSSIHALHTSTEDLLETLITLGDSSQMLRQTGNGATRVLKAARETTAVLRKEFEEAEEGRRRLEVGGWEEKLRKKEAALVCREVVGGFEAVCEDWRRRLVGVEGNGVGAAAG